MTWPASPTSTDERGAPLARQHQRQGDQERRRRARRARRGLQHPHGRARRRLTLSEDGSYTIAGLEPGPYVIRVEPLDDADINSFFDSDTTSTSTSRCSSTMRVVVVPSGGGVRDVNVKVTPK
jgi:hypothetical protein